jgi:molybdenum cofactor cytidylyltransferase
MRIQALLLAAGASHRFGAPKLLTELAGESLVSRAARNLLRAGLGVRCVVRPDDEALMSALRDIPGVEILVCPDAALGMGHSLAGGVSATADADAWLVALADMPSIAPATIRAVESALRGGASLVVPTYGGRRGHPVGFGRDWLPGLMALSGDLGARALLESGADELTLVRVDDPGILRDVDTAEHLRALAASLRSSGAQGS